MWHFPSLIFIIISRIMYTHRKDSVPQKLYANNNDGGDNNSISNCQVAISNVQTSINMALRQARTTQSFNFNFSLFVVIIYIVTFVDWCQRNANEPSAAHQLWDDGRPLIFPPVDAFSWSLITPFWAYFPPKFFVHRILILLRQAEALQKPLCSICIVNAT